MPKILILTSEFPPQPGGIGNHAYNLAKGLQDNDFEVKVVCDTRSANGEAEKVFDTEFSFELIAQDEKARVGKINTHRGIIDTPTFMTVGMV